MTATEPAIIPRGAAFALVPRVKPTRSFTFVLVPGFTLLAFSSAVEPLRIANQLSQQPLYRWTVVSGAGGLVPSSAGIAVDSSALEATLPRDTTLLVCAGNQPLEAAAPRLVSAVARHARFGGVTGGICTGAVALARAGLLRDRRFTLHWENQAAFLETFPDCRPSANRFEIDGALMTCGGGAAATDMMLSLIAAEYGGTFAASVADMCLRSMANSGSEAQRNAISAQMASRKPALAATVRMMTANLEDPLTLDALATRTGYSRRHLERLFDDAFGQAPGQYYLGLRLDQARKLLCDTDMGILDVATATGFKSVAHFSRRFKIRFGRSPSRLTDALGTR